MTRGGLLLLHCVQLYFCLLLSSKPRGLYGFMDGTHHTTFLDPVAHTTGREAVYGAQPEKAELVEVKVAFSPAPEDRR